MNRNWMLAFSLLFAPLALPAQDATNSAPTPAATTAPKANVDMEKIRKDVEEYYQDREALNKLPVEERNKKQAELNQKRSQQLQTLSLEEKRAWMLEWRKKAAPQAGVNLTERRLKSVEDRINALREKKAKDKLTESEEQALERFEKLQKELKDKLAAEKEAVAKAAQKPAEKPAEKAEPAKN